MKNKLLLSLLACAYLQALEFGYMGNISTSMGGAGVALEDNDFALYYNPALLTKSKDSFAYSFGISFSQNKLFELSKIDKNTDDNLKNQLEKVKNIFAKNNNVLAAANNTSSTNNKYGNFSPVVSDFIKNNKDTNNEFSELAKALEGTNGQQNTSLETAIKNIQEKAKNDPSIEERLTEQLLKSTENSKNDLETNNVDAALLGNIISATDSTKFLDIVNKSSKDNNGAIDIGTFLTDLGDIDLTNLVDDKTASDISVVYDSANGKNDIRIISQNGFVYNFAKNDNRGAISFGIFTTLNANANAALDPNHNVLIVKLSDNKTYIKLDIKDGKMHAISSTKEEFEASSALNKQVNHALNAGSLALLEVPVAYADEFALAYGDLSLGATFKYIFAAGYDIRKNVNIDLNGINKINFKNDLKDPTYTHTIGLDLGVLYSLDDLNLAMVIKNINNPKVKLSKNTATHLNPQVRIGAAYKLNDLSFAMDLDLLSNKTLSLNYPKSQTIGAGVKWDIFKNFNVRGGLMYDFKQDQGAIITAGMNVFNFFDLSIQSSFKTAQCSNNVCSKNIKLPQYFTLKLGGSYSW